jgi:hypothetical protein
MAPEYAFGGLLSIKSDVFSFGVLILEIISGKRSAGFQHSGDEEFSNLLQYVRKLKSLKLVHSTFFFSMYCRGLLIIFLFY